MPTMPKSAPDLPSPDESRADLHRRQWARGESVCLPAAGRGACFPGARELLLILQRLGLRCAIVSNTLVRGGENYRRDFADYGFDGLVDAFVTSIDLRVRKPDPRIFDFALRTIGCTATNVVMVGNSEFNDIEPAARLGARTIRVAIEEPVPAQSLATVVVGSLFDVAQQIEHWALPGGWHSSSPSIR
jgi:FMN phosphatase YigB (HAD superfamily)